MAAKARKQGVQVLLVRPADSAGYTRFVLADPIGKTQAGAEVLAELGDGNCSVVLTGQKEFDVPSEATSVTFPDGTVWKKSG